MCNRVNHFQEVELKEKGALSCANPIWLSLCPLTLL